MTDWIEWAKQRYAWIAAGVVAAVLLIAILFNGGGLPPTEASAVQYFTLATDAPIQSITFANIASTYRLHVNKTRDRAFSIDLSSLSSTTNPYSSFPAQISDVNYSYIDNGGNGTAYYERRTNNSYYPSLGIMYDFGQLTTYGTSSTYLVGINGWVKAYAFFENSTHYANATNGKEPSATQGFGVRSIKVGNSSGVLPDSIGVTLYGRDQYDQYAIGTGALSKVTWEVAISPSTADRIWSKVDRIVLNQSTGFNVDISINATSVVNTTNSTLNGSLTVYNSTTSASSALDHYTVAYASAGAALLYQAPAYINVSVALADATNATGFDVKVTGTVANGTGYENTTTSETFTTTALGSARWIQFKTRYAYNALTSVNISTNGSYGLNGSTFGTADIIAMRENSSTILRQDAIDYNASANLTVYAWDATNGRWTSQNSNTTSNARTAINFNITTTPTAWLSDGLLFLRITTSEQNATLVLSHLNASLSYNYNTNGTLLVNSSVTTDADNSNLTIFIAGIDDAGAARSESIYIDGTTAKQSTHNYSAINSLYLNNTPYGNIKVYSVGGVTTYATLNSTIYTAFNETLLGTTSLNFYPRINGTTEGLDLSVCGTNTKYINILGASFTGYQGVTYQISGDNSNWNTGTRVIGSSGTVGVNYFGNNATSDSINDTGDISYVRLRFSRSTTESDRASVKAWVSCTQAPSGG